MIPADALLGLPESDFSALLAEWDQAFCVQNSYDQSRQTVQRVLGLGQSVRRLEQMSVSMAADVEAFRASPPVPPAAEEGPILVLTADGKGVPMRRQAEQDPPAVRGRRAKGEKANQKRMACVGGAYTIDPFVRTAEDVVDEVRRDARRADRPEPRHKQLRAELTRPIDGVEVNGKELIFGGLAEEVEVRNPKGDKPVVCVMDGERALWKNLTRLVAGVVCILDVFHVLERLWQAAHCFHVEGSDQAQAFVTDRLLRLLRGEVGYVIGGLRQMATKQKVKGSRARQLSAVIGYLEGNRRLMRYDAYLAAGYPIGSGVAEGACRHLVKDRMELTGMHWRVPGAQAMLDLRAVYINGDWDGFQQHRIAQERRQLYPYRSRMLRMRKKVAWRKASYALIITQSDVVDQNTGDLLGRIDVRLFHGCKEDVYFAFECKRLNVLRKGARQSLAGEYADEGMARFVSGKYAGGLDAGGMLGYVMDGDLKSAMAAVKEAIEERRTELCMDSGDTPATSSVRPRNTRVKETSHRQAGKPFLIHHVFLPVG